MENLIKILKELRRNKELSNRVSSIKVEWVSPEHVTNRAFPNIKIMFVDESEVNEDIIFY